MGHRRWRARRHRCGVHHLGLPYRRHSALRDATGVRRRTSGQRNHVNGNSSSENRSAPINLRRLYVGRRRRRDGTVLQASGVGSFSWRSPTA